MKWEGLRKKSSGMQGTSAKRKDTFSFVRQLLGRSRNRRVDRISKGNVQTRKNKQQTLSLRERWKSIQSSLSRIVQILGVVLTMGGIFGIGYGVVRFLRSSKHFAIQHVSISPLKYIDAEKVHTYAQTLQGKNLFSLDLEKAQRELAEIPGIAHISMRRKIPNSLVVDIKEHTPTMVVDLEGPYCANDEGEIFRHATPEELTKLPILVGLPRAWFQRNSKKAKERVHQAIIFTKIYNSHEGEPRPKMEGLRFTSQEDPTDLVLYTKQGIELWLNFDHPEDAEKMLNKFDSVWNELKNKPTRPTVLLLNNRAHPDWVIARY